MCFGYGGYMVHRLGLYWYLIIGPYFRGYETSESAARKMIDGIIFGHCEE
jgi:hypothetical protein